MPRQYITFLLVLLCKFINFLKNTHDVRIRENLMKIVNVFLAYHGYSSDHKKNCVLSMSILQRMKRSGNEDSSSDSPESSLNKPENPHIHQ